MITCRLGVILAERKIMRQQPYTQVDIVKETGLSPSTVSNLVNNATSRYDAHVLDALCRVLNVQPGDLLEYIPEPEQ